MALPDVLASLHPLERKVLPALRSHGAFEDIVRATGLKDVEVMRALQWLQNKGLLKLKEEIIELAELETNGKKYAQQGLPEYSFLAAVTEVPSSLAAIKKKAGLSDEEAHVSIGLLRRSNLIAVAKRDGISFSLTAVGKQQQGKMPPEQALLKSLPLDMKKATAEQKRIIAELRKRKQLIAVNVKRYRSVELTAAGKNALRQSPSSESMADHLTAEMLKTGSWKEHRFRTYDITAPVPKLFPGKKQPYREFLEEVRQHFLALGFTEMNGPIVETEFWNMDALFMPQFHSARDIHDAYYVKEPTHALPLPKDIVAKVKKAHEKGVAGSRGWRYSFDVHRTHRHILRTHDTSISPRILASPKLQVPGKYFQMVRCFRYDVIDATHLPDFTQVGGFVIEPKLTLRHLVGLLTIFAKEFCGTDQVKVLPAYFPFTEPSAALYAKHPQLGWIELAGSGMFRPEMNHPLGVKEPVIAWGIGLDRVAMFRLGIKDIRQLFSHDVALLRSAKVV